MKTVSSESRSGRDEARRDLDEARATKVAHFRHGMERRRPRAPRRTVRGMLRAFAAGVVDDPHGEA